MLKVKYMIVGFITVFTLNTSLLAKASEKGDPARGREIFAAKCTPCHGQTGHGDGPGAASLQPKPRNFSDAKYVSTLASLALDDTDNVQYYIDVSFS